MTQRVAVSWNHEASAPHRVSREGAMRAGTASLGFKLLGVWLILYALMAVTSAIPGFVFLLAIVAFAAGVLILIGR